ncbi:MAG: putative sulfate/molybdate transporter, partial [Candidatus Omnitrophica bacterium]|nr:putative sulfate/molybdate transporter [Candidatus Omnitrophota bacterium]
LAGLMNVLTGIIFRLPIPVQPMKAMATVVIAESMLKEELFAAGIIIGVILLFCTWSIDAINRLIPKAVVRGIQLGIGFKLILKACEWIGGLSFWGWDSWVIAILVAATLLVMQLYNKPGLVAVFGMGFVILLFHQPEAYQGLSVRIPEFHFSLPGMWAFKHGFYKGVLPQLPLTLLNSVVAVCALSESYFPRQGISPRKMVASVGLMNLITVPFGGIPMCHGAGGLAAQYRFGARTGGSVIMLGGLKIFVGILFGQALFEILQSYPLSILGTMLVFSGAELVRASGDCFRDKKQAAIALVTAIFLVVKTTFVGFIIGMLFAAGVNYFIRRKQHAT